MYESNHPFTPWFNDVKYTKSLFFIYFFVSYKKKLQKKNK